MHKDEIDDLVDGLNVPEHYQLERPRPWRIPRWVAITVPILTFLFGAVVGLSAYEEPSTVDRPTPVITKTKTETVTEPAIPPSCQRALDVMKRMMEANSTIAGAGEEQLDISHAARQAIFLKDWQALDKAMVRQTDLNNRLDKPNDKALKVYGELVDAMKECADAIS